MAALSHLADSRETREQAIDLRLGLRNSLFPLGEIEAVIENLRDAERLATALEDQPRLARVLVATSHHYLVTGDAGEAHRFGTRAFTISETLDDRSLQVATNLYLGAASVSLGEFRQADECLGRTTLLLKGDLVHERFGLHGFPAAIARSYMAWVFAERGNFAEAIARGQEGVDIADAAHHAYSQAYASWGLAFAHVVRGDLTEAARVLERATDLVREWNLPLIGALVSGLLGLVRARSGRAADGVELLQEAVTNYERLFGNGIWHSLNVTWLSEALLRSNRPEDARSTAELALALTREFNHRICEPWALRVLGEIAACRESPDNLIAEDYYRQALALAEALGMSPLVASCHLGLAKLPKEAQSSAGGRSSDRT